MLLSGKTSQFGPLSSNKRNIHLFRLPKAACWFYFVAPPLNLFSSHLTVKPNLTHLWAQVRLHFTLLHFTLTWLLLEILKLLSLRKRNERSEADSAWVCPNKPTNRPTTITATKTKTGRPASNNNTSAVDRAIDYYYYYHQRLRRRHCCFWFAIEERLEKVVVVVECI